MLICNSLSYGVPTIESIAYNGLQIEQLAQTLNDKSIQLSIFSPRKISFLFKLYEKCGGDLKQTSIKNYAKDSRYLILLRGFQLQERPCSPPSQKMSQSLVNAASSAISSLTTNSISDPLLNKPAPSPVSGQKRPLSPGSANQGAPPSAIAALNPAPGTNQPMRGPPPLPPHAFVNNQPGKTPTPDQLIRPNCGNSPAPRMTWNNQQPSPGSANQSGAPTPPISSPSPGPNAPMSALANQLTMPPMRTHTPNSNMQPTSTTQMGNVINVQMQTSNATQTGPQMMRAVNNSNIRPIMMMQQQVRPGASVYNQQPAQSPLAQNRASPHPQSGAQQITMSHQQPINNQIQGSQMIPQQMTPGGQQQQIGSMMEQNKAQMQQKVTQQQVAQQQAQQQQQQVTQQQQHQIVKQQQATMQQMSGQQNLMREPQKVWAGIIEYLEKPGNQQNATNRISYALQCQMLSTGGPNDIELNPDKWPDKLTLQLLPKQFIAKVYPILKSQSMHIQLHFANADSESYQKLTKIFSTTWVGCIQLQPPATIRMIIVLYVPEKRAYSGFIPNDQEAFFSAIKQVIDQHRNQQAKNKMVITFNDEFDLFFFY